MQKENKNYSAIRARKFAKKWKHVILNAVKNLPSFRYDREILHGVYPEQSEGFRMTPTLFIAILNRSCMNLS
jgi:hypothetical protein